jgi:ComF family protein
MLKDFFSLIYPHVCAACGRSLYKNEYSICTFCYFQLPRTNFHRDNDNPIAKIFWGRINIHSAASYYNFGKGGKVQQLIHQLKYKGRKEVGVSIGKLYGNDLRKAPNFCTVDSIIPVPLHPGKQRKRGYNQSECFAEGLSQSMKVTTDFKSLRREAAGSSQTKKSRFSRWENVETAFQVKEPEAIYGKHVLLVDDVVTTGATLEACAASLLEVPGVRVSIATIAYAR